MQKKCDIYLCDPVRTDRLRFASLFDKSFQYDENKTYVGYLGLNIDRVKLVSVVLDLKKNGVACFSVSIEYRVDGNLPIETAADIASEYAMSIGASAAPSAMLKSKCPPVYWIFDLRNNEENQGNVGGVVMVDRIDGHVWSQSENEEYMYDFNNIL